MSADNVACAVPPNGPETAAPELVADNVLRIPLPLPLAELRSVNCYAVFDSEGLTLIDPGWASQETQTTLARALKAHGSSLDEVGRMLVTHSHWDHYTQAYSMSRARGIPLMLGREEQHSIAAWADLDGAFPNQVEALRRAGAREHADILAAQPVSETEQQTAYGHPTTYLDGGERLEFGDSTIGAMSTPGHTRGHLVFHDERNNLLFTGDHILPRITPSIAYERSPDRLALRSYMDSLRLLVEHPPTRMMPAHGLPQSNVHDRAVELLAHHEERLAEVLVLMSDGASTGFDIARGMKWTRRNKDLTDLDPSHQWTAILEATAHADLLVWRGDIIRNEAGPVDTYSFV